MLQTPLRPAPPRRAENTKRHEIVEILQRETLSARDISGTLRIAEKEIYDHLEHIRMTMESTGRVLEMIPPQCMDCGFIFRKRDRLTPPGKCPVCRSETITNPVFHIR